MYQIISIVINRLPTEVYKNIHFQFIRKYVLLCGIFKHNKFNNEILLKQGEQTSCVNSDVFCIRELNGNLGCPLTKYIHAREVRKLSAYCFSSAKPIGRSPSILIIVQLRCYAASFAKNTEKLETKATRKYPHINRIIVATQPRNG